MLLAPYTIGPPLMTMPPSLKRLFNSLPGWTIDRQVIKANEIVFHTIGQQSVFDDLTAKDLNIVEHENFQD